mgnify:CR=1 FL=1
MRSAIFVNSFIELFGNLFYQFIIIIVVIIIIVTIINYYYCHYYYCHRGHQRRRRHRCHHDVIFSENSFVSLRTILSIVSLNDDIGLNLPFLNLLVSNGEEYLLHRLMGDLA